MLFAYTILILVKGVIELNYEHFYPQYHQPYNNVPTCQCGMRSQEMPYMSHYPHPNQPYWNKGIVKDHGPNPFVVNINEATIQNDTYRTALWTGKHLQLTLMSINPGEDIGLEIHPQTDQFLRIEQGQGYVQMGNSKENLYFTQYVGPDSAIFVPAGTWHNVTNIGSIPLRLYSIYAPPNHPFGTVSKTKAEAMAAE